MTNEEASREREPYREGKPCEGGRCVSGCGFLPKMDTNEYIKLADVEDRMWYFRALHGHIHRLLAEGVKGIAEPQVLEMTGGRIGRVDLAAVM